MQSNNFLAPIFLILSPVGISMSHRPTSDICKVCDCADQHRGYQCQCACDWVVFRMLDPGDFRDILPHQEQAEKVKSSKNKLALIK